MAREPAPRVRSVVVSCRRRMFGLQERLFLNTNYYLKNGMEVMVMVVVVVMMMMLSKQNQQW